jgi:hypothetical protein
MGATRVVLKPFDPHKIDVKVNINLIADLTLT